MLVEIINVDPVLAVIAIKVFGMRPIGKCILRTVETHFRVSFFKQIPLSDGLSKEVHFLMRKLFLVDEHIVFVDNNVAHINLMRIK